MAYDQFDKIILLKISNEHFGKNDLDEIMILTYKVQRKWTHQYDQSKPLSSMRTHNF